MVFRNPMWRKIQKSLATVIPSLILVVFLIVLACYLNRWDSMTAITLIPIWAWSAVGMLACILSWIVFRGIPSVIVFSIWLVFGITLSEETHGLFRELVQSIDPKAAPPEDRQFRVVSLNAAGSVEALEKAFDLEPDLVIVQNSPRGKEVTALADEEFGSDVSYFVASGQAIIGRGELMATLTGEGGKAIHARLKLPDGFLIDITGIHLDPSHPSPYLWKPGEWKKLTERRIANRRLLRKSLGENRITRSSTGRIVAGGFNTPPGDDVFRPLQSNDLIDTFRRSGTGWGNTYPANYPALRYDQIWSSTNLPPVRATTHRNSLTDHRMVVTDLALPAASAVKQ